MTALIWMLLFAGATDPASLTQRVAASGRVLEIAVSPSERLDPGRMIPPGAPPLLSFRLFEGRQRQRFGGLDLVLDDAGH